MKKNIIYTPRERESLLEILIQLFTGEEKSLLDWVKDNMI